MSIVIPEWFKIAKPDSAVTSKEIVGILKIHTNKLAKEMHRGEFPFPDFRLAVGKESSRNRWRISTLRKEFNRRGILRA